VGSAVAGVVVVGLAVLSALPGSATVDLRWAPADTTIDLGDTTVISVLVDDPVAIRTFEAWIAFDDTIVSSVDGMPGQLYMDTGVRLWEGFEEVAPGNWHGYWVVMSNTDWTVGPGELFAWTITGINAGTCPVTTGDLRLWGPDGENLIADVSLAATTVIVDDSSRVPDDGSTHLAFDCYPNPFNPHTELRFIVPGSGKVRIDVFDLRGNRVATAFDGWVEQGSLTVPWDASDDGGRSLASGVYLFRLTGPGAISTTARGVLLE